MKISQALRALEKIRSAHGDLDLEANSPWAPRPSFPLDLLTIEGGKATFVDEPMSRLLNAWEYRHPDGLDADPSDPHPLRADVGRARPDVFDRLLEAGMAVGFKWQAGGALAEAFMQHGVTVVSHKPADAVEGFRWLEEQARQRYPHIGVVTPSQP
jgi:hypothetical protein